jgi:Periplasmic binding protein
MEDDVMTMKQAIVTGLPAAGLVLAGGLSWAAGQYGPGASDTEIKIGNTVPYSGPASAYGTIGKSEAAYFAMINDQGGINGRKVNFLSRDDSYSPPKTLEVVRKLVEEDQVLLMFGTLGTPPNTAIQGYLNDNKVPQLHRSAAHLLTPTRQGGSPPTSKLHDGVLHAGPLCTTPGGASALAGRVHRAFICAQIVRHPVGSRGSAGSGGRT